MKTQALSSGRIVVGRMDNFVQWCAWRYWLHRETGRTYFPDRLIVWSDWPPETQESAQLVAQKIREARQHPKVQYDLPVCDPCQPWDRWAYNEREDLARKHREDLNWIPPLPSTRISRPKADAIRTETEREMDQFMKDQAAKLPSVPRGKGLRYLQAIMAERGQWRDA